MTGSTRREGDEVWQQTVVSIINDLEAAAVAEPKYDSYDPSAEAANNRAFIRASKEMVGMLLYWFASNTGYYQSLLPIDKDEMIRRLDQIVRTLRHTR